MKKKIFAEIGACYLSIFAACFLNLFVMSLVINIADLFVEVSFFAQIIIRCIVSALTVGGIVGSVNYLVSYRRAEYNPIKSLITVSSAVLIQLLLSILLKFRDFIGGGSIYLASILHFGSSLKVSSDAEYITFVEYITAFAVYAVFLIAVYMLCGYFGKKIRHNDREELLKNTSK